MNAPHLFTGKVMAGRRCTMVASEKNQCKEHYNTARDSLTLVYQHGRIPTLDPRPHRLAAQDAALSRPKRGFDSPWGHT